MNSLSKEIARLQKIVESFANLTITVVGDMIADEFIFGEISRVSREAPVLILQHRERTVVPGGGANAVSNLSALGVKVLPVGIVGDDEVGRLLLRDFRHGRIPVGGVLKEKAYATVTKTRILAGMTHTWRQQVVRVDREPKAEPGERLRQKLIQVARKYLQTSDALLWADYGYGSATPTILDAIRKKANLKIPVVVDSRHRLLQYAGVTAATPNEPEVEEALGVKIGQDWRRLCQAGEKLISRMKLKSLLITRGHDGMVAFHQKQEPVDFPIFGSDQAVDVTGAGDTVIATFTAALAAEATATEAAHLANCAGGLAVMKRGTATVPATELLAALEKNPLATRVH